MVATVQAIPANGKMILSLDPRLTGDHLLTFRFTSSILEQLSVLAVDQKSKFSLQIFELDYLSDAIVFNFS